MGKDYRKRWIAGALAFTMCCTSLISAGTSAVSAETGGYQEQEYTEVWTEEQTETSEEYSEEMQAESQTEWYAEDNVQPQTEPLTEKSEEELFREIEADPQLQLMLPQGEPFDIRNDFTGLKLRQSG